MPVSARACRRRTATRAWRSLAASAVAGIVVATLACGALPAQGEAGPSSNANGASCPSPNPPTELTLTAGTPQTATLGSAFATNLQVAFANGDGCPVTTAAGIPVTFSAPAAGASGSFSASGTNAVAVGSDASGTATAPPFTANYVAGSYTLTASSAYGSISFSLTNVEGAGSSACATAGNASASAGGAPARPAGRPSKLAAGIGATQATPVGTRFPIGLAVTVTDTRKEPVPGALVTFAAPDRGPSGYFTPSRMTRRRRVEVKSNACGIALAPAFTANRRAGGYVVVASVKRVKAAFALVNEGR